LSYGLAAVGSQHWRCVSPF